MENHKEVMNTHIAHTLLLFILLNIPNIISGAVAHSSSLNQRTESNDTLYSMTDAEIMMSASTDISDDIHTGKATLSDYTEPVAPETQSQQSPPNAGCAVGTPEGAVSVSASGAAVYNMSIATPNGGTLTPQIGLSYNSQDGGYGLAGYGFNITGISAITRGVRDPFHHTEQYGVTYLADDDLYLDGKRMILQGGASLQDGAIYTIEGDPFTKIVVHGNYNSRETTAWFEVTTNNGMTYEYGHSSNSRIAYRNAKDESHVASWYISRAKDKYSNYITYDYAISNLSIRPTTITYGTNSLNDRGLTNKVCFSYQSLGENTKPFTIEDKQGMTDMCLSSVTTTSNNSVYRKYTFTYDDSDQSTCKWARLVTVEEENGEGEKLPPVKFTWQHLPSPDIHLSQLDVPTSDGRSFVEESDKQFLSADLNGDGISDIIRIAPVKVTTAIWPGGGSSDGYTCVYVSKSRISDTGNITYDSPLIFTLPSGLNRNELKTIYSGASAMDFDGDGHNDLVIPFQNVANGHWNQAVYNVIFGSDVTRGANAYYTVAVNLQADKVPLFAAFDVNGNGKDDIVCIEARKKDNYYPCTIVQHAEGRIWDWTEIKLTLPQGVNKDIDKVFVGDYNNDGLSDLILLYDGGYKIYFNDGGVAAAERFTESNTKSGTDFGNFWRIQQGDFDGDGLMDFVYNKSGESCLWVVHNNGDGTFTHTQSGDIGVADHASNKDDSRFTIQVYDIDHDGRSDVMICKAGYRYRGFPRYRYDYTDTPVRWLCSTGSNLKLVSSYTKSREDDANETSIFLGDFDGDGYLELANYGSILNSDDNAVNEQINVYKTGGDLLQEGRITGISDGMGNSSYIQYASATSPTVYKKSLPSTYPVNTYTLPLPVVAKVTSDNGSLGSQVTKYSYEDLRLHIAGRGMLGFNTVTTENITLGTKEVSSITKWDESLWIPKEIKSSSSVGNTTSTTVTTYNVSKTGNNYFAYVSKTDITDMDGNKATTTSNYDVSKGVLVEETVRNDGDNMYKKVAYSGFQNKAGAWLPTTLTMTQKHADAPSPHTTVTTYEYDDKGNVVSSTTNRGTDMELTTTSTYDVYGNVLSSVTTGNGVIPITKYNDYDPSGRFVVKSYTAPGSAVNTFTYDLWGNVLTENDVTDSANILTTKHTYDGWGRNLTTLSADGTMATHETGWGTSDIKKYYTKEAITGRPSVTTWYDKGGHEVLQESVGIKNLPVSKATTYNSKGQVSRIENKTGKLTITQDFTYDERGRIVTDVSSSGKSATYSYGNRTVSTNIAGRTYTKTYDAWGNIITSTDPVSEVEYHYSSIGKPSSVKTHGSTVTMTYDAAGNKTSLSDPDAGTTSYTYAADGRMLTQTDGRGIKTTNHYDNLGRLSATQIGQETINYTYGTTGNENLRLVKLESGNNSVEYTHDKFGRVITEKRNIAGHGTYDFSYTYNDKNQLSKTTYPGGLEVAYQYDDNGFKLQSNIGNQAIYKVESADGLVSSSSFLGNLTATRTRDTQGFESNLKITHNPLFFDDFYDSYNETTDNNLCKAFDGPFDFEDFSFSTVLENFDESYDTITGNMLSRKRNNNPQETFSYDNLDRLVSVKSGETETMSIDYAPNGNILFKTGVGDFSYDEDIRPHAVTEVENTDGEIPSDALTTSFNDFGKIHLIEDAGKNLSMRFYYGPDLQRWYSVLSQDGTDVRTTIYANGYEKITENGRTREFYYLDGNTIIVKENGIMKKYLAFTDNLGSILSVMDKDGNKVFDASYDAWGRQTITLNTIGLQRGYTGHEMINEFDIINMNGRLYDPVLGRFFSPDNYVQMPDNSQNFNRYSYCLNNPLKYTDPSGNLSELIAFAAFSAINSMMQAKFNGENVWKAGALSLLSSAASYGIGEAFKGATATFGNELLRAGAHGLASGVISALDGGNFTSSFISGAAASGIGSYAQSVHINNGLMVASTTAMGGFVAWATGGDFLMGAMQGMSIGVFNHGAHGDDGIRYYHDEKGNLCGDIREVVVTPNKTTINKISNTDYCILDITTSHAIETTSHAIEIAAGFNTIIDCFGTSLKNNSGNSTVGNNGKSYWRATGERGFYGNQYVKAYRLTDIGTKITNVTGKIGYGINGYKLACGIYNDYNDYHLNGYSNGYNTVHAAADVAGGWAGALAGAKAGAAFGAWFEGFGAIPGAIIGGAAGGIAGSFGGSSIGTSIVDWIYGR